MKVGDSGLNNLGILFLGVGLPLTKMTQDSINGETPVRLYKPAVAPELLPFPMPWMPDRLGPDRIQDHIAADLRKVSLLVNENRFKPALKQMADWP
jgi:hypothetical protein